MRAGTLFDSPKYVQFVSDRNKALEQVHLNAQTDISRITFELLDQIEKEISRLLIYAGPHYAIALVNSFDQESIKLFHSYLSPLVSRIQAMRRAVYLLSYAGELEAISRATSKHSNPMNFKSKLKDAQDSKTLTGKTLTNQVWGALMNLRSKVLKALRQGIIMELKPKEILEKVQAAFPQVQTYAKPPRALKPIVEAEKKPGEDDEVYDGSFASDEDWDLATDAYKSTMLPPSRFDNASSFDTDKGYMRYNWELEQDLTDDFVNQVRSGQVDAANELGISDLVWVAIIDAKTCEVCCEPRNGKTTSEIQSMLDGGDLDADACDATNPPAHPNCRCNAAPVSNTDEVAGPDWKSFNDWLSS